MRPVSPSTPPVSPSSAPARGFALVVVLIFLALSTILIVGLLLTIGNDRKTAKLASSEEGTQQLAEAVAQIVIGQIRLATSGSSANGPLAWASQPGMIRTYDNTGTEQTNYKLYSSDHMTTTGPLTVASTPASGGSNVNDFDLGWASYPGVYTDLNSPVTDASGYVNFPILDGNNIKLLTKDLQGNSVNVYYGYDAEGLGLPDVKGFSINRTPAFNSTPYSTSKPLSPTNTPVPMPVKWLYQLRNGALIAPDVPGSATNVVTFTKSTIQASSTNPIVARIAFWTDDETCKVNINTAAGDLWTSGTFTGIQTDTPASYTVNNPGAFWDTPRVTTWFEHDVLAGIQPALNEFQRYPGLVSTIYLTSVFSNITSLADLFSLTPRMGSAGSSLGGSQTPTGGVQVPLATGTTASAVNLNNARLYASIDELQFKPTTTTPPLRDTNTSILTENEPATLTAKDKLEQARFFITADSRAPEVNLFGKPRVTIWPVNSDVVAKEEAASPTLSPYGTPYDLLMAFCSHIGPLVNGTNDYIFQRKDSTSFLGSNIVTSNDYYNIPRNQSLYAYLESLTSLPVPGFGGPGTGFLQKYGNDRDQILTEIFDYIRSTNLSDENIPMQYRYTQYYNGSNPGNAPSPNGSMQPGAGQVTPIQITSPLGISTMGFGRFLTLSEVGLQFICCADGTAGTTAASNPNYHGQNAALLQESNSASNQMLVNAFAAAGQTIPASPAPPLQPNQKVIQAIFLMNPYCVAQGNLQFEPTWQLAATGLTSAMINGTPLFQGSKTVGGQAYAAGTGYTRANWGNDNSGSPLINGFPSFILWWGGNVTFRQLLGGRYLSIDSGVQNPFNPTVSGPSPTTANSYYPFVGFPILVNDSTPTMTFSGGPVAIKTYYLSPTSSNLPNTNALVQTINVNLASLNGTLPIPNLVTTPAATSSTSNALNDQAESWWSLGVEGPFPNGPNGKYGRLAYVIEPSNGQGCYIRGGGEPGCQTDVTGTTAQWDVVRTMVPGYPSTTGTIPCQDDVRLIAACQNVPASAWVPQRNSVPGSSYFIGQSFGSSFGQAGWGCGGADLGGRLVDITGTSSMLYSNGWPSDITAPPKFAANGSTGGANAPVLEPQFTGDFDNGCSWAPDGAYINKADEGDNRNLNQITQTTGTSISYPYFDNSWTTATDPAYFSPNRMLPSPGMFGSLPTGVQRAATSGTGNQGWQTLLFRPGLLWNGGSTTSHPNAGAPLSGPPYNTLPDYLWMDLFWMPAVEPYAISNAFSTAGKVNMNYQIAPFTYINRSTAVIGALKAQKLLVVPQVPSNPAWFYKSEYRSTTGNEATTFRQDLNLSDNGGSLTEFLNKFNSGDIFRSPSQICDIDLVPLQDSAGNAQSWTGATSAIQATAAQFWANNALTGDNSRERPYANLYGLLTTKSNTYTVHFRVQTLQKIPATPANEWIQGQDVITSDYRGSSVIERYLDPGDPTLPDFTQPNVTDTLDNHYKFHILSTKRFSP